MNPADKQSLREIAKAILSVIVGLLCWHYPYLFAVPTAFFIIAMIWTINK